MYGIKFPFYIVVTWFVMFNLGLLFVDSTLAKVIWISHLIFLVTQYGLAALIKDFRYYPEKVDSAQEEE